MPHISVVIPTHNRIERLKRVLAALECQDYALSDFEVIVVSDGSSDSTDEYLRTLTTPLQLHTVVQPNQGVAVARNNGVRHATGDLVLFIDDDVVPSPQLIVEHIRLHTAHADDVIVLGPMLTPADFPMSRWVRWEQAMLTKQYDAMRDRQIYAERAPVLHWQHLAGTRAPARIGWLRRKLSPRRGC